MVLLEVVPGFWTKKQDSGLQALLADLRSLPYLVTSKEVDLALYIPQKRVRGALVIARMDILSPAIRTLLQDPWAPPPHNVCLTLDSCQLPWPTLPGDLRDERGPR